MISTAQDRTRRTPPRRLPHRHLQELRINEGMSPNDLGLRAGVSGKTVRLAEAGWIPSPWVQYRIAQVFKDADGDPLRPLDLWPLERQKVPR
jgi:DNA-binding XRE family transcriptional regulator